MGKGGCSRGGLDDSEAERPTGALCLKSLFGAFQSITSTRWAHNSINGRLAVKRPTEKPNRIKECGTVSWEAVREHSKAESCWIVVRNKVGQTRRPAFCSLALFDHAIVKARRRSTQIVHFRVQVYDITNFAPIHPGGKAILAYGGRDASDVFAAFHAAGTHKMLKQFYIGEVEVCCQYLPLDTRHGFSAVVYMFCKTWIA
jgi:cytochrome b involved in lipid metabolism